MADASDVEAALVTLISDTLYPNGTTQPSGVNGTPTVSIERGWPTEADLRTAVSDNIQLVRVHAIAGMARDSERYFRTWQQGAPPAPTVTATVSGLTVTIGGTATAGNVLAILTGGVAYTYVALSTDTLASIATALAAKISGASSSGAVITVPASLSPTSAAVFSSIDAAIELGRQKQVFSASVWATSPVLRDAIFSALMPGLALPYRLTLPDGSIATRGDLQSDGPNDIPSRAKTWVRDIRVAWEFPLIAVQAQLPAAAVKVVEAANIAVAPTRTTYRI